MRRHVDCPAAHTTKKIISHASPDLAIVQQCFSCLIVLVRVHYSPNGHFLFLFEPCVFISCAIQLSLEGGFLIGFLCLYKVII